MAVISGKGGTVLAGGTPVAEVTLWRLVHTANNSAWASSSTGGYKQRVCGTRDWSGMLQTKRDTAAVIPLVVGTIYELDLTEDGTKKYEGSAIIDAIDETVDIDTGEAIGLTIRFSGAGGLTVPV